jgi:hypothetical protein
MASPLSLLHSIFYKPFDRFIVAQALCQLINRAR